MLRSLLSVCSILVLLLPTFVLPERVAACPVKLPETLLSLYRNSDAIYVGTFDKVSDYEIIEDNDERTVVNTKRHFDISSTLKGEPRKLVALDDTDYRYKNIQFQREGPEVDEIVDETDEIAQQDDDEGDSEFIGEASLASGDPVILFLSTDTEDGTLQLTDYRDGVKKVSGERLDAYEARIRDLNSIFSAKQVDDAAIVDWLVKCAKDPLTRWEGAFELQQSFQELRWQQESEAEQQEEDTESEASESEDSEETGTEDEAVEEQEFDRSIYARLLTDTQKQMLIDALLEPRNSPEGEDRSNRLSVGDKVLIDVVANWGDTRFAGFLLERLRTRAEDRYFVNDLMEVVGRVLKDNELQAIASRYSDAYYQDDDDAVEEAEGDEDRDEPETPDMDSSAEAVLTSDTEPTSDETAVEEHETPRKQTYKELRAELVGKFIDRGFVVLDVTAANQGERASR